MSEEWNFGYGPDYKFRNSFEYENSDLVIRIEVMKGIISSCKIMEDSRWDLTAKKIVGMPHTFHELSKVVLADHPDLPNRVLYSFFN